MNHTQKIPVSWWNAWMVTIATKVVRCKVRADVYWDRIITSAEMQTMCLMYHLLPLWEWRLCCSYPWQMRRCTLVNLLLSPGKVLVICLFDSLLLMNLILSDHFMKTWTNPQNIRKCTFWLFEQYPGFNRKFKWRKEGSHRASQNFSVLQPSSLWNGLYEGIINNKLFIAKRITNYFFLEIVF